MAETIHEPLERRPLASRSWKVSRLAAEKLARAGASPNGISMAGMAAGVLAGLLLASTSRIDEPWSRAAWLLGALFVQARLAANLLDGMVAVATGRTSPVGELYNEVPDRISDMATLAGLGYASGGHPVLGWAAASTAVLTAYVRAMGKAAGAPQDYRGPMAKPHRMFIVTVTALWCAFAPGGWGPAVGSGQWGPATLALAIIAVGSLITCLRSLRRPADVLRGLRGAP